MGSSTYPAVLPGYYACSVTWPIFSVNRRRAVGAIWTVVRVLVCLPLVTVAMIVIHEAGHTLAAWAVGDWHAYFVVYRRVVEPSGAVDTCIGCNLYNSAKVGALANVFVCLAGVGATAIVTWAAVLLLWRGRPRLPRWLLVEVALLCWFGDALWQVVQALPLGVPAREPVGWGLGYTDLSAAGSFYAQATGWPRGLVEGLGLTGMAVYSLVTLAALAVVVLRQRGRRIGIATAAPAITS